MTNNQQKSKINISTFIFYIFSTYIALTPIWLGSNRPTAWAVNGIIIGIIAIAMELDFLIQPTSRKISLSEIKYIAIGASIVIIWCIIQILPFTPTQWHHPIWRMTSDLLDAQIPGSISVSPEKSAQSLLRFVTYCLVFYVSTQLCVSQAKSRELVAQITLIGLAYAIYGIISNIFYPNTLLIFDKTSYIGSVTSTYVNRNNYATYAGIGLICSLSLTGRAYARTGKANLRDQLFNILAATIGMGGIWLLCDFVIFAALVSTGSRAGVFSTFIAMFSLFLIYTYRNYIVQKRALKISNQLTLLSLITILGVAIYINSSYLISRIINSDIGEERRAVYLLVIKSIKENPIFGYGDGTFSSVIKFYRDDSLQLRGIWDKAHNTYLELFQGLGIPIAMVIIASVLYIFYWCLQGALNSKRGWTAIDAAVASSILVAFHALVDFSLQIEAVTITWLSILGAGFALTCPRKID